MTILKKILKNTLQIKNNIKKIFLYDCDEYIEKRKENFKYNKTSAFFENEEDIRSEKLIFALFFVFLFTVLTVYYIYIEVKDNIVRNNVALINEPLSINVDNPFKDSISDEFLLLNYKIQSGDTLIDILTKKLKITYQDAYKIIAILNNLEITKDLRVGQEFNFKYKTEINKVDENNFEYLNIIDEIKFKNPKKEEDIVISRTAENEYQYKIYNAVLIKHYEKYVINIKNSIYVDGVDAGIPPNVLIEMLNYFSFDFDFARDIREGDKFEIFFEYYYTEEGKRSKAGDIIFANINSRGKDYKLYRYSSNKHGVMYFDDMGISNVKSLLKTPINSARISSNYNLRRKHPVLGYVRAHKGVDFAAPVGTPFFAGGTGTVVMVKKGYNGGYGNYIRVKHNTEYSTAYAHLSRFAKNLYVGKKVKQGEVIGYVGATGRVTGPHLHYEILYKNKQINPASIKGIANIRLTGTELTGFKDYQKKIDIYRDNTINSN